MYTYAFEMTSVQLKIIDLNLDQPIPVEVNVWEERKILFSTG